MKIKRTLELGHNGDDVKFLQEKLKEAGLYKDKVNGYFTQNTLMSVSSFQKKMGLKVTGKVSLQMWSKLISFNEKLDNKVEEKDCLETIFNESGLTIYKGLNNTSDKKTLKNTIFLFINNSSSRPDLALSSKDPKSHYIIGRKSSSCDEDYWDGKIIKSMDDKFYLNKFDNQLLNERSIFIEICNYGELKSIDGIYYNVFNKPVIKESEIIEVGGKYYEKITENQINSLISIIRYLKNKWNIDFNITIDKTWFDYNSNWLSLGGLRTLGQVIKEKSDLFPQEELIKALNSI